MIVDQTIKVSSQVQQTELIRIAHIHLLRFFSQKNENLHITSSDIAEHARGTDAAGLSLYNDFP